MSVIWQIPLQGGAAQTLQVSIGSVTYTLHFTYNMAMPAWIMDINDSYDVPICQGIPLVTGTDLMGQFRYLGIGGGVPMTVMTVGVGKSPDEIPTYENLGIEGQVFYKTLE